MQEIRFDTGVKEYRVNGGGVLRFNPTDPALYGRFMEFQQALGGILARYRKVVEGYTGTVDADGWPVGAVDVLAAAKKADGEIKEGLGAVFGSGNDFGVLLQGVNILAVTDTGATVAENLLEALMPVLEESAAKRQERVLAAAEAHKKEARERREALEAG